MIKKIMLKKVVLAIGAAVSFLGVFGFKKDFSSVKAMESRNLVKKEDVFERIEKVCYVLSEALEYVPVEIEKNKAYDYMQRNLNESIHYLQKECKKFNGEFEEAIIDKTIEYLGQKSLELYGKQLPLRMDILRKKYGDNVREFLDEKQYKKILSKDDSSKYEFLDILEAMLRKEVLERIANLEHVISGALSEGSIKTKTTVTSNDIQYNFRERINRLQRERNYFKDESEKAIIDKMIEYLEQKSLELYGKQLPLRMDILRKKYGDNKVEEILNKMFDKDIEDFLSAEEHLDKYEDMLKKVEEQLSQLEEEEDFDNYAKNGGTSVLVIRIEEEKEGYEKDPKKLELKGKRINDKIENLRAKYGENRVEEFLKKTSYKEILSNAASSTFDILQGIEDLVIHVERQLIEEKNLDNYGESSGASYEVIGLEEQRKGDRKAPKLRFENLDSRAEQLCQRYGGNVEKFIYKTLYKKILSENGHSTDEMLDNLEKALNEVEEQLKKQQLKEEGKEKDLKKKKEKVKTSNKIIKLKAKNDKDQKALEDLNSRACNLDATYGEEFKKFLNDVPDKEAYLENRFATEDDIDELNAILDLAEIKLKEKAAKDKYVKIGGKSYEIIGLEEQMNEDEKIIEPGHEELKSKIDQLCKKHGYKFVRILNKIPNSKLLFEDGPIEIEKEDLDKIKSELVDIEKQLEQRPEQRLEQGGDFVDFHKILEISNGTDFRENEQFGKESLKLKTKNIFFNEDPFYERYEDKLKNFSNKMPYEEVGEKQLKKEKNYYSDMVGTGYEIKRLEEQINEDEKIIELGHEELKSTIDQLYKKHGYKFGKILHEIPNNKVLFEDCPVSKEDLDKIKSELVKAEQRLERMRYCDDFHEMLERDKTIYQRENEQFEDVLKTKNISFKEGPLYEGYGDKLKKEEQTKENRKSIKLECEKLISIIHELYKKHGYKFGKILYEIPNNKVLFEDCPVSKEDLDKIKSELVKAEQRLEQEDEILKGIESIFSRVVPLRQIYGNRLRKFLYKMPPGIFFDNNGSRMKEVLDKLKDVLDEAKKQLEVVKKKNAFGEDDSVKMTKTNDRTVQREKKNFFDEFHAVLDEIEQCIKKEINLEKEEEMESLL